MKKIVSIFIICVIILMFSSSCAVIADDMHAGPVDRSEWTYHDFIGKTIGMPIGSIWDAIIENSLNAVPAFYPDLAAGIEDVRMGRIDGNIADTPFARVFISKPENAEVKSNEYNICKKPYKKLRR